jgi:hypothetical protein
MMHVKSPPIPRRKPLRSPKKVDNTKPVIAPIKQSMAKRRNILRGL